MRILFLTGRFPGPAVQGDQVRARAQLAALAANGHRITLLSLVQGEVPASEREAVQETCERIVTVAHGRLARLAGIARAVPTSTPLQVGMLASVRMRAALDACLARDRYDVAHVQLARMAPYLADRHDLPRVLDLIDSLALNMERRAQHDRAPLRWLAAAEGARLRRFETTACEAYDRVTVVSPADRATMARPDRVDVLPLAVALDRFPYVRDGRTHGRVVLSGNLRYFPNRDAAEWWLDEVLPRVRTRIPSVETELVGAEPPPALARRVERIDGVTLVGRVPEMAPRLAAAAVAIAPLRAGSGVTSKILEAMAVGTPVVATRRSIEGLAVEEGEHLLAADDPQAFADAVAALLADPDRAAAMAARARRWVEEHHGTPAAAEHLERLYDEAIAAHRGGP